MFVDDSKRNSRAEKDTAGGNRKISAVNDSETKQREVATLAQSYIVSHIRVCPPSMKLNTRFHVSPCSSKHESRPPTLVREGASETTIKSSGRTSSREQIEETAERE